jgi:hypothetical protein
MSDRDRLTQHLVEWCEVSIDVARGAVEVMLDDGWVRGVVTDGCVVTNEFLERLGWIRLQDADLDAGARAMLAFVKKDDPPPRMVERFGQGLAAAFRKDTE